MYFWAGNGTWGSAPTMCWSQGRDSQPSNQSQSQKVESPAVLIESTLRLAFDFDEIRPGHPGCGIRDDWKTSGKICGKCGGHDLGNLEPWPYVHKSHSWCVYVCQQSTASVPCITGCTSHFECVGNFARNSASRIETTYWAWPKNHHFAGSLPPPKNTLRGSFQRWKKNVMPFFIGANLWKKDRSLTMADLYGIEIGSMSQNFWESSNWNWFWPHFSLPEKFPANLRIESCVMACEHWRQFCRLSWQRSKRWVVSWFLKK